MSNTEASVVKGKFRDLLNHLGTMEGVEATGDYLPAFIASLLDISADRSDKEIGLSELLKSVRGHLDALAEYEMATRQ
jgi:hypothetical protein